MKKKLLCTSLLILSLWSFAQELVKVIPPSPNASSIEKYSLFPISPYLGTADVSVPIYTVKTSDIEIPIRLRYDTSGVRVAQEASWVGLGWNLNPSGVITRTIIDGDDFGVHGFLKYDKVPSINGPKDCFLQKIDTEPDLFTFNFLGYSGKFYFPRSPYTNKDYIVPVCEKKSNLDIRYYFKTQSWKVRDLYGNIFFFKTKVSTIPRSKVIRDGDCPQSSVYLKKDPYMIPDPISSWYLDKIRLYKGSEINFEYSRKSMVKGVVHVSEIAVMLLDEILSISNYGGVLSSPKIYNNWTYLSRNDTDEVYLKKIRFDSGEILFGTSNRKDMQSAVATSGNPQQIEPQKLDFIQVKDSHGKITDSYRFRYDYFRNDMDSRKYSKIKPENYLRLKLKGVEVNKNNKRYSFVYNEGKLPSKISNAVDYWGYFNGHENRIRFGDKDTYCDYGTRLSAINTGDSQVHPSIKISIPGANRNPDSVKCRYGVLKSIQYPTGGKTSFFYEPHVFDISSYKQKSNSESKYLRLSSYDKDKIKEIYFDIKFNQVVDLKYNYMHSVRLYESNKGCEYYLPRGGPITSLVKVSGDKIDVLKESHIFSETSGSHSDSNCTIKKNGGIFRVERDKKIFLTKGRYKLTLYNVDPSDPENEQSVFVEYYNAIKHKRKSFGAGLRIKRIVNYSSSAKIAIAKKYDYTFSYTSNNIDNGSGELKIPLSPFFSKSSPYISNPLPLLIVHSDVTPSSKAISYNHSVGYDRVYETTYGEDNVKKNGIVEYNYHNDKGDIETSLPRRDFPISPSLSDGLLYEKVYYDSSYNPLKKEYYNYNLELKSKKNILASKFEDFSYSKIEHGPDEEFCWFSGNYNRKSEWWQLDYTEITEYFSQEKKIEKTYYYYNSDNLLVNKKITTSSSGKSHTEKFLYAKEKNNAELLKRYRIGEVLETQKLVEGSLISKQDNIYKYFGSLYLRSLVKTLKGKLSKTNKLEDRVIYHSYDDKGNPLEISKKDGAKIYYVWGYQQTQPIAKIEGYTDGQLSNIQTLINTAISKSNLDKDLVSENALRTSLKAIRDNVNMKDARITTYTYDPLIGVTSITDPRGETVYYEYDDFNRLQYVKDALGNVLKEHQYHYKN